MQPTPGLLAEDVLTSSRLYRRPPRAAELDKELAAYRELSSLMAVDPQLAIERFLELALELCPSAGSAGLSELSSEDGEAIFRWTAMGGALKPYVGGTTPRDFSPCGLCLDQHHTILVERPERVFTYFAEAKPRIYEGLIVPLYDTGKRPLGTLWITSHRAGDRFDATDARVMEQLAVQLVLAIKLRKKAKMVMQLEEVARDKEVLIEEVRHRVKNTIQMAASMLQLQEKGTQLTEVRSALREAQSRLLVLAGVYEALLLPGAEARRVDVSAMTVRLVDALRLTSPTAKNVRLTCDCDPLFLDVNQALPLSLILNEALTNTFKHAFGPRSTGQVMVRLEANGAFWRLTVSDDGRGFNEPARDGSLGMRLMTGLARQLGARLTVSGTNGVTVLLESAAAQERPCMAEGNPATAEG